MASRRPQSIKKVCRVRTKRVYACRYTYARSEACFARISREMCSTFFRGGERDQPRSKVLRCGGGGRGSELQSEDGSN